ncbi:MAG: cytochrome c-type biogenesis protein CcmH [Euryarchaeota archaeon]|nr:cytochrome c-type biogenesis protein CcmH [Euryarchaeota archaeon]MBU4220407.1 cytochrome c-type biogenesis protein CcmH [Euryarchaeota archaeon]MCG2737076.1 cytochrome c-type biogenesis protein CcmH [Candidatus Methanoperedenaceae archaeon]
MMNKIIAAWFFLLVLAIPVLAVTEEEITSNLNCPEGGGCTMLVIDCPMDSANEMKETVRGMVAQGMSESKIYKELEAKYGREVFATPPKEGFDWIVWLALPVGIIVGGVVVYKISRKRMDENEEFELEFEKFLQEKEKHE